MFANNSDLLSKYTRKHINTINIVVPSPGSCIMSTISSHHHGRKSKQIHSLDSTYERGEAHREWWIIGWEVVLSIEWSLYLGMGFKVLSCSLSSPDEWPRISHWGTVDSCDGVDVLYHNMCCKHNAICSTSTLCDATRCYSTLECRSVATTDFQSMVIILWPGIQFVLQYCRWVWAEIDLKREILSQWEMNCYCSA